MDREQSGRVVPVRLSDAMIAAIESELARRVNNPLCAPWTKSEWIRQAICDKLAHAERSRRKRRKSVRVDPCRPEDVADDSPNGDAQHGMLLNPLLHDAGNSVAGLADCRTVNVPNGNAGAYGEKDQRQ